MESHQDKVVLITGASSGIGFALAREFGSQGYKVYGTTRNIDNLNPSEKDKINFLYLDITDENSIKRCVNEILAREKRIDILVNNAGYGLIGPVAELFMADFEMQLKTNVTGLLNLSQLVVKKMMKNRSGMIVNISSISVIINTPFSAAYCASKAAVNALSEVMRYETRPFNVRVITVQPGAIKSNFGTVASKNLERYREDSFYRSIFSFIEKRAMQSQVNATPAEEFARRLVKKLMKKNPKSLIRIGKDSFKYILLKKLLPGQMIDRIVLKRFGLDKL